MITPGEGDSGNLRISPMRADSSSLRKKTPIPTYTVSLGFYLPRDSFSSTCSWVMHLRLPSSWKTEKKMLIQTEEWSVTSLTSRGSLSTTSQGGKAETIHINLWGPSEVQTPPDFRPWNPQRVHRILALTGGFTSPVCRSHISPLYKCNWP